jgi:DNA invertase Pin-like site-specific DNA recombinase
MPSPPIPKQISTAWLYAAVSSSPQEATLEDQLAWGKSVAVANGWTITREFSGVGSGAKGTRDLLKDLLAELRGTPKARRPKHLLMIRLDRLGRGDGMENIGALSELRSLGVAVFTRDDGLVRLSKASDALLPAMKSIVAGIENEIRSEKWRAVHARRRAQGLHVGLLPFGCVLVDGRAVPFEPEAAIVREIFRLAEARWGYTRLARWAREHALAKRQADGSEKPYRWNASTIKSMLESKTLRGLVVTEGQWQATKAARQSDFRARAPRRWAWPLQGAVRCTCGKLLAGHASGTGKYRTRYYICRHHSLEPGEKSHPSHRADGMESAFVELLRNIRVNEDLFVPVDEPATVEQWKAQEREARRRVADLDRRIQKAWALAEDGKIKAPDLSARLAELNDQRGNAESALSAATEALQHASTAKQTMESVAGIFERVAEDWPQAPLELQQEFARACAEMLEGLRVDPERKNELILGIVASDGKADDSITKKFIQSITE